MGQMKALFPQRVTTVDVLGSADVVDVLAVEGLSDEGDLVVTIEGTDKGMFDIIEGFVVGIVEGTELIVGLRVVEALVVAIDDTDEGALVVGLVVVAAFGILDVGL